MKKLIFLSLLLTGCASFRYKVVGWDNTGMEGSSKVLLNNGQRATILGNPPITCYNKKGLKLADGYFVAVVDDYLIVDEFGTKYFWLRNNTLGNYCMLWNQQ